MSPLRPGSLLALTATLYALGCLSQTARLAAQVPAPVVAPPPLVQQYQANTPVALTQYSERPSHVRLPAESRVTGNISAGTTLQLGNSKMYSGSIGGRFLLIKQPHQLSADVLGNWSAAQSEGQGPVRDTARNIVGRLRYDLFVSKADALFVAMAPRRDRFSGLDLRLQTQAGYLRNLYAPRDNHRFWSEVGYDGTYDNFTPYVAPGAMEPAVSGLDSDFIHSGRGFLGYANQITPLATVNLGLEVLVDFQDKSNTRVNSIAELTSSLSERFKMSLQSRVFYDQLPVEGKQKSDYLTTAQLVYSFDTGAAAAPPCTPCDCSAEVQKVRDNCKVPEVNQRRPPLEEPRSQRAPAEAEAGSSQSAP